MQGFPVCGVSFLLSLGMSLVFTPLVRRLALKWNYVAVPRPDRWHQKPTGLLGGVSIFGSVMAAWLVSAFLFSGFEDLIFPLLPVALCAAAVFLLGLADDLSEMNAQYKLIGQVVAASVLVVFGFQFAWFDSQTANILVSIFWIVGITNAFNLLDNMDGLSAGIAAISGFFLWWWLAVGFDAGGGATGFPERVMLAALIGGLLGFLVYNFNPASIFMGDAGSLFIGFLLASLTLLPGPGETAATPFLNQIPVILIPCLILFVPILDTVFVSFMRKLFARSIFQGGRDHSSHRMVAMGFSEKKAVVILYGFAVMSGAIGLGIYPLDMGISVVIIALYLILVLLFWMYLAKVKVYAKPAETASHSFTTALPLMFETGYARTLFSILLDLLLITIAYYTSYLLRFGGVVGPDFHYFLKSLPIVFASQIFCFYVFGVYQRLWSGSRLGDVSVYVKGVTGGTVMTVLIILLVYRFQGFSRAVFIIYWGMMLILLSFSRFFFRLVDEWARRDSRRGKPALIYGAGIGGQMVVREIETNDALDLSLAGFIDDDPRKKGKTIHGYPVLGNVHQLGDIIRKHQIREIIVSFRDNGAEKKKEIQRWCQRDGHDVMVRQMRLVIDP